jgi:hypothetical protein
LNSVYQIYLSFKWVKSSVEYVNRPVTEMREETYTQHMLCLSVVLAAICL